VYVTHYGLLETIQHPAITLKMTAVATAPAATPNKETQVNPVIDE
jgi:hypothetical protein